MINYFKGVWKARYFWWHLSMSDLRARWRRTFFGVLWSILQPLGLTLLLALVFSRIFNQTLGSYALYILSGLIIWDYVGVTTLTGATAFIQADAYIKQTRHPLAIYTLRNTVANLVVLMVASTSLIVWVFLTMPNNFGWCWLGAFTLLPILALIAWPLATLIAYAGTRFRDLPHALALILQAMWFVSPIYFKDSMFRSSGLTALVEYNPIYHLLQIARAPLLDGQWPTLTNYVWCLSTAAVLTLLAIVVGSFAERKVIYYL